MPGGALVREAEEPAESVAKECQYVRYHRSKERERSTTKASAKGHVRNGGRTEEDPTISATQLESIGWLEGAPQSAIAQDSTDRER